MSEIYELVNFQWVAGAYQTSAGRKSLLECTSAEHVSGWSQEQVWPAHDKQAYIRRVRALCATQRAQRAAKAHTRSLRSVCEEVVCKTADDPEHRSLCVWCAFGGGHDARAAQRLDKSLAPLRHGHGGW